MEYAIFFAALMYNDMDSKEKAISLLEKYFGRIILKSDEYIFDSFSDYYSREMGKNLKKFFIAFGKEFKQNKLCEAKKKAVEVEEIFAERKADRIKRRVNIDIGYITIEKCVLSTRKDRAHRVCICDNIFAEVAFIFRKHDIDFFPWSYEDYKSKIAKKFFLELREILLERRKKLNL